MNNKILFLFLNIPILIVCMMYVISQLLKTNAKSWEKMSPFECGFNPSHKMRNSFSLRFFLITILFLIFDAEATALLPLPLIQNHMLGNLNFLTNSTIILILLGGLILEWQQGVLEWSWTYI